MKKQLIFFALLFFQKNVISQSVPVLKIYYDQRDCINCNVYLHLLKNLPESTSVEFIINEIGVSAFKEMLGQYELTKDYKITKLVSKVNGKGKIGSSCSLYYNNAKLDTFSLKELALKTDLVKGLSCSVKNTFAISLKDTLSLSQRINLFYEDSKLLITDYILNKAILLSFDLPEKKNLKTHVITCKSFLPDPFLYLGGIDSLVYKKEYNTLKHYGKHIPHIERSFMKDSFIYFLLTFPYPEQQMKKGDLAIMTKLFMYKKDILINKDALFYMRDTDLKTLFRKNLLVDNSMPFFIKNNKFYFSIFDLYTFSRKYFLSEHVTEGNNLVCKNVFNCPIDSVVYKRNSKIIENSNILVNNGFYFFNVFPYVFDYQNNKHYCLNALQADSTRFFISDVVALQHVLKIILRKNKKTYLILYNTANNTVIREEELKFSDKINELALKFIDPNRIITLGKNNDEVIILDFIN